MSKQVEGPTFEQDMQEALNRKQKISNKVKGHFKKYKKEYIVGGVGFTAGVGVGYYLHKRFGVEVDIPAIHNVVAPIFNNTNTNNNNNSNVVNFGGYSRKLVKCVDTGQIWESVKDASAAAGVEPSVMSRHLNGHSNDVKGRFYEIIGVGTNS